MQSGSDSNENDAIAIWKSLQGCNRLTLENLSDPTFSVQMPWPSILVAQLDRMKFVDGRMDIVGREFFGELYRHAISDRQLNRVNVMGTKGIGKSYRLVALVGLLLKEVCEYSIVVVCVSFDHESICPGPSCGLLAQLRSGFQIVGTPFTRCSLGRLWR